MPNRAELGCGAAIRDRHGRLLLIQRLNEPEAKAWGLPGGKIELGEPAHLTARREVREELGIQIGNLTLATYTEIIDGGDARHWISPIYEAQIINGVPAVQEPDKHGGWGWFALDDLPTPLTTPTRTYLAWLAT